jgi:dihydrodipicolinate synthase/N-acetylneuraminate lyase
MSVSQKWSGVFPVVPTPLNENQDLDIAGLKHLVDFYIGAGCHGLLILGSGGEYPYLSLEERIKVIELVSDACKARIPIISGCGFLGLKETITFIKQASAMNIDGFLCALPTYYPPAFDDTYHVYKEICNASTKPIFYYHYPQVTGLFFSPSQMQKLLSLDGIIGMKESTACVPDMKKHLEEINKKDFNLFAGTSYLLLKTLEMGGKGVMCPIPSIAPGLTIECYDAWHRNDKKLAQKKQEEILDLIPLMNTFDIPAGLQKMGFKIMSNLPVPVKKAGRNPRHAVIKETLRQLGHPISAIVRSPLPQITKKEQDAIALLIENNEALQKERLK